MGVLGLRKFIDASSCTRFLPDVEERESTARGGEATHETCENITLSSSLAVSAPHVDHVLVDMNCIIHSCFRRDMSTVMRRDVVQAVMEKLRVLLTEVVVPRVSLTICIDGPAPYAKLQTQRLRRRRLALLDTASTQQLTSLAVTPGSLFLVELENALAAQFKLRGGRGFLPQFVPVFLHGSTVIGEGEAKIARALAHIASTPLPPGGRYNPNHTVVVIGNDIDLTLTCLGATQYHNLFVVGPSSMQVIDVSEMLYRWLRSGTQGAGEFCLSAQELASVRVDFVFLFLLNGGDHYVGVGDIANVLWKRYRTVRSAYMQHSLVSPDLMSIDVDFLSDVLQASDYTGDSDVEVGMELLRATLWSLHTTVTGVCPDYQYVPAAMSPHINHVRAAVVHCQKNRRGIRIHHRSSEAAGPLTPLETFVALMPTEAALPTSVAQALRSSRKYESTAQQLLTGNDAAAVARAAKEAVKAAEEYLTVSERYLREFTTPVQLNVPQPPRRLSRHEQHRMIATKGRIEREVPLPLVERVAMPENFYYVNVAYPSYIKNLQFSFPFDRITDKSSSSCNNHDVMSSLQKDGGSNVPDLLQKRKQQKRGCNVDVVPPRRIPAHPQQNEEVSAARQMEMTLQQASALKMPEGRDKKTLRRLKKRLHAQRQLSAKQLRSEESGAEARQHLLRKKDKAFLAELRNFLGEDGDSVQQVLSEETKGTKRREKHKRKKKGMLPATATTAKKNKRAKKEKGKEKNSRPGKGNETLRGRKRSRETANNGSVTPSVERGRLSDASNNELTVAKRRRREEVSAAKQHCNNIHGEADGQPSRQQKQKQKNVKEKKARLAQRQ